MSSNNLDKYEFLTGEDLNLKPSTVEEAKFEYSPLGKIFNKGLSEEDKKEGLFKRLENVKDKNEELINRFSTINKASKNKKFTKSDVLTYNTKYSFLKLRNIDDIKKLSLDSMFNLMKEHYKKLNSLINLKPRTRVNKNKRLEVTVHAGDIYNELYNIYRSKYNKKIDSLIAKNKKNLDYKQLKISGDYRYSSNEEQEEQEKQDEMPFNPDEVIEWMISREKLPINNELFKKHFKLEKPTLMYKVLYETNNDKEKNSKLVNIFNSGCEDLGKEIKEMSKEEIEAEKPYNIVKVVKKILEINKINQQKGQGIKILTPNQMLSRSPITLIQLKAGNNSEKLKNEIRQLLYSLYRSKNMTKQVYNNLINYI